MDVRRVLVLKKPNHHHPLRKTHSAVYQMSALSSNAQANAGVRNKCKSTIQEGVLAKASGKNRSLKIGSMNT
jgi:hypothetical protein